MAGSSLVNHSTNIERGTRMGSINKCLLICSLLGLLSVAQADLQLGFYAKTCPKAESIVFQYVREHIPHAPSLAAALLRMHFHDCFVRVKL